MGYSGHQCLPCLRTLEALSCKGWRIALVPAMDAPSSNTPNPQISLFSPDQLRQFQRPLLQEPELEMSQAALVDWKLAIASFQHQVKIHAPMQQGDLFGTTAPDAADPDAIDPFSLPIQNTEFWRWRTDDAGVSSLYFVIDHAIPLLLYVGETVKSNQRWKGLHDCKRYMMNYRQLHRRYQLPSRLNISFWRDAPAGTRDRQKLESALIYKWRSPFNKENWAFWGTPFTQGKEK